MRYIISAILFFFLLAGCSKNYLSEEAKTEITVDKIYNTPDGIATAAIGLYYLDRSLLRLDGESDMWLQLTRGTDISASYAGSGNAAYANYDPAGRQANEQWTRRLWDFHYSIIGKANEVIFYGNKLDQSNALVKRAVAEASFFRANSYLWLYKIYNRIYLNTESTTPENVDAPRTYTPATKQQIMDLLYKDLDVAIAGLPQSNASEPGRLTWHAARHVKALVAMWNEDYDEAINQAEAIFADPSKSLVPLDRLFGTQAAPLADLNHSEALYVWQFANSPGGANTSGSTLQGHRLNAHFVTNYHSATGIRSYVNGGGGWGRVYPNSYLRGLYNQPADKRFGVFFKTVFIYDDPTQQSKWPAGTKVGDTVKYTPNTTLWVQRTHPSLMKYYDPLTSGTAASLVSFKDYIVYRLAETYLLAAEAYMRKGNQAKAREYYNKTWVRAGNTAVTTDITLQMIMDEHARELCFETHRWGFLKRIGKLIDQVKLYSGDAIPGLSTAARTNIQPYHVDWPIPQTAIDVFGKENFPQNPGYNQ